MRPVLCGLAALLAGCTLPCEPWECEPPVCGREVPQAYLTRGDAPTVHAEDGDGIVMVHGPQGGWHLSLGVMIVDPHPFVILDISVVSDGATVVENHYELELQEHDGCTGVREDLYGFLDVRALEQGERDTPPELLADQPLQVHLDVQTSQGFGSDTVTLIGVPDPVDVPD